MGNRAGAPRPSGEASIVSGGRVLSSGPVAGMVLRTPSNHEYTLQKKLGSGGFGSVWSAQRSVVVADGDGTAPGSAARPQMAQTTQVAIKFVQLTGWLLSASSADRTAAMREAELLLQVEHPYLTRCYEFFNLYESRVSEWFCVVMELATRDMGSGLQLKQYLLNTHPATAAEKKEADAEHVRLAARGRVGPPEEVLRRLLIQVANALRHLHRHGVIHRDVKPANILLFNEADQPDFKLADVGVATVVRGGDAAAAAADDASCDSKRLATASLRRLSYHTATVTIRANDVAGTLVFMAPEMLCIAFQLPGGTTKRDTVASQAGYSHRCDAYSLGATGLALAHGANPHPSTVVSLVTSDDSFVHGFRIMRRVNALGYSGTLGVVLGGLTLTDPTIRLSLRAAVCLLTHDLILGCLLLLLDWIGIPVLPRDV